MGVKKEYKFNVTVERYKPKEEDLMVRKQAMKLLTNKLVELYSEAQEKKSV